MGVNRQPAVEPKSNRKAGESVGTDLRTASNWDGERYDCLSYTLEMPFKDNANAPDDRRGWSPERSAHLGHDVLAAMAEALPMLR